MKKLYLVLAFLCSPVSIILAQTTGNLDITVTTSSTGGNFAPKNSVAIWVEDGSGNFVKTLLAYSQTRISQLNNWQAATLAAGSEYNRVDAVTGVIQNRHGIRSCTWDGTDFNGTEMPDGTYTIRMELTDKNATGNFSSFTFTKGPDAQLLNPTDVPSFSSINLEWTPSVKTGFANTDNDEISVYPNPGTGIYTVRGNNVTEVEVKTLTGRTLFRGDTKTIDITKEPKGIYLILIKAGDRTLTNKLIKN